MSNPVTDCLMNHRSIRRFKSDPIPPELLDQLFEGTPLAEWFRFWHGGSLPSGLSGRQEDPAGLYDDGSALQWLPE